MLLLIELTLSIIDHIAFINMMLIDVNTSTYIEIRLT